MGSESVSERERPVVSAIVPTVGRPTLQRALRSAKNQRGVTVEVVLVIDSDAGLDAVSAEIRAMADVVIATGGRKGGGHARNVGVENATGDWVAFLDDDDEWATNKSLAQLHEIRRSGRCEAVAASRHVQVGRDGRESPPLPARLIGAEERVEDYLFRRRRPSAGRAVMYTSTLFCSIETAKRVRWNEGLRRHQDWDWLVRASRAGHPVIQAPDALCRIYMGSSGSISASADWEPSLAWAEEIFPHPRSALYSDFVMAQPFRYALNAHSLAGITACLRALISNRRFPAIGPIIIGMAGFLPRRAIERIVTALG